MQLLLSMKYWTSKWDKNTTQVLLFKTWYFGHTGRSRFQTDQSATQNCYLIQNDIKFQGSVSIFLNKRFHAIVLTKFPLSLFNTLPCPYLTTPYQFPTIPSLSYCNTYFSWRKFGVLQVEIDVAFLCVFCYSRGWPVTFDDFLLVLYRSTNDFLICFIIIY